MEKENLQKPGAIEYMMPELMAKELLKNKKIKNN